MNNTTKKLIIGAAISGLFLSGEVFSEKQEAGSDNVKGECHGVNSCKGKSDCHSNGNSCSGQNSCKGKGWISLTKKECDAKKGDFKKS
ncbi:MULTISPECIES: hypothetical protein [unclassified Leptospira]|uniref:BufA2 family periplasmic bufferin-type metallophore n=1 Tax=unclassified Leptospira TaxID=2633828 RepID=UPI0002BEE46D|nr:MULTISPECIES: hypothetical protein [unclassified Leptospira]EMK02072.1 hypothetical protein LEP1GSC192_1646 [Leptospira sp. B5-022]MCR1793861.1 hypothetical protein [Leptospira sp. id769339]